MSKVISASERKRLISILGMLGSDQVGERDNAARLAEKFRLDHDMTWSELLTPQSVVVATQPEPQDDFVSPFMKAARDLKAARERAENERARAAREAAVKTAEAKAAQKRADKNAGLKIISRFLSYTCVAILWWIFGWKDTLLIWIIVGIFEGMRTSLKKSIV